MTQSHMEALKIVLVDDHQVLTNGLKAHLENLGNYNVTHTFESGEAFLTNINKISDDHLIFLDIEMRQKNGFDVLQSLNLRQLKHRVIMLSVNNEAEGIIKAISLGAVSYLTKTAGPIEIKRTIEEVIEHGSSYSRLVTTALIRQHFKKEAKNKIELSENELQFVKLYASTWLTTEEIADKVCKSVGSINNYRNSVFQRYNLRNRAHCMLWAFKNNIISDDNIEI